MTELLPNRPVPQPGAERTEGAGHPLRLAVLGGLVLLAGLGGGWPLLVMITALVVMITLHELGHFLTAKWAGMKVTEFFLGFGPRIWSFRRGETEYGLKVIPAGAYVKIVGMHNLDEFDERDTDRTYMSKPFWRRLSVAVAGSTMHFLLALVCFFVAFAFIGVPGGSLPATEREDRELRDTAAWVVEVVSPESGAEAAGVAPGDRVLAVDGIAISGFGQFTDLVRARPDQVVPVLVERDGAEVELQVTIGERDDQAAGEHVGFFGVGPRLIDRTAGLVGAFGETGRAFGSSVTQTISGLGHILSPSGLADLGQAAFTDSEGPSVAEDGGGSGSGDASGEPQAAGIVRISDIGRELLDEGEYGYWLAVFATINIFIGIFNLLPLLPLDGGHVAIAVYEKIQSLRRGVANYHVDVVKLLPVTYAAVMVLVFLGISTLVLDTRTLVGG